MTYSQPGIFNVLDDWGAGFGMVPNDPSPITAENNALALQATIDAAQAYCAGGPPGGPTYGATILIPSNDIVPIEGSPGSDGDGGTYYIAVPSASPPLSAAVTITCPYALLFLGTGNGTLLMMVGNSNNEYGDVIVTDLANGTNAPSTIGGISFQDFQIQYAQGATAVLPTAAALHIKSSTRNVRLFRMIFIDCPIGIALEDSLQFSMIDCEVENNLNSGTAVSFGNPPNSAKEIYIAGCIFEATGDAYGTGTCFLFSEADEVRIVNTRIDSFLQGIAMTASAAVIHLFFENVSVFAAASPTGGVSPGAAALTIAPQLGASVTQALFVGCEFSPAPGGVGAYDGPGISIGEGSGGIIDQIRFVSCYSCTWPGAGMLINGATNVEILGGYYSCNGSGPSPPTGLSAGIAITAGSGEVTGVRIVGTACNNSIYNSLESVPGSQTPTQQFGIFVENEISPITNVIIDSCDLSGNLSYGVGVDATATSEGHGVTDLFIRACNLTGNGAGALDVTGTAPAVQVTDCAGYNDQATPILMSSPATGATIANYLHGYYGPVAFYVVGNANATVNSISVDGHSTGLTSGGFTLAPGEFASILWTPLHLDGSPTFLMVGK